MTATRACQKAVRYSMGTVVLDPFEDPVCPKFVQVCVSKIFLIIKPKLRIFWGGGEIMTIVAVFLDRSGSPYLHIALSEYLVTQAVLSLRFHSTNNIVLQHFTGLLKRTKIWPAGRCNTEHWF